MLKTLLKKTFPRSTEQLFAALFYTPFFAIEPNYNKVCNPQSKEHTKHLKSQVKRGKERRRNQG